VAEVAMNVTRLFRPLSTSGRTPLLSYAYQVS
jgi:hypothetical protein